ncbi:hypothetical protein QZH45_09770 [Pseudomonas corrugata]|uniref:hypothetical protein n=1 Tax=Pseudomonas corrugata TaxID=47879 RepID=UPI003D81B0B1
MNSTPKLYVDSNGKYLGAMDGDLLKGSPHPYPNGKEVGSAPDSVEDLWSFTEKRWIITGETPDE